MGKNPNILIRQNQLKQFLVIVGLYFLGLFVVATIKPSYMVNILIVYLPGLVYLFSQITLSKNKILIFSMLSILFIIPVELLARLTDSWDVQSSFPRLLGIAPVENMLYGFINIIYPITFYEFFYDGDNNRKISQRWKVLLLLYLTLFIGTFTLYYIKPGILRFDYYMLGIIIFPPIFILLGLYKRHIIKRLILPAIVFGLMFLFHEALSMYLGHWWWPGEYLIPLNIYGHTYPLDDIIIWMFLSNIAVISGYEALWD